MGYKNFQTCKEIYLPICVDDSGLTFEQYREKYGVDLKQFVYLDDDYRIRLKFLLAKIFIVALNGNGLPISDTRMSTPVFSIDKTTIIKWEENSVDGETIFGKWSYTDEDVSWGIQLIIPKGESFDIENIRINWNEI